MTGFCCFPTVKWLKKTCRLKVKPASEKIFHSKLTRRFTLKVCAEEEVRRRRRRRRVEEMKTFSILVRCEPWGRCSSFGCCGQMLLGTHKRDGWPLTEVGKTPVRWWWGWRGYLVWAHVVSRFMTFLPSSTNGSLYYPASFAVPTLRFSPCCFFSRNITLQRLKKENTLLTCQKLWGFYSFLEQRKRKRTEIVISAVWLGPSAR